MINKFVRKKIRQFSVLVELDILGLACFPVVYWVPCPMEIQSNQIKSNHVLTLLMNEKRALDEPTDQPSYRDSLLLFSFFVYDGPFCTRRLFALDARA